VVTADTPWTHSPGDYCIEISIGSITPYPVRARTSHFGWDRVRTQEYGLVPVFKFLLQEVAIGYTPLGLPSGVFSLGGNLLGDVTMGLSPIIQPV